LLAAVTAAFLFLFPIPCFLPFLYRLDMPMPETQPKRYASMQDAPHPAPEAEEIYRRWIQFLDDEFTRHNSQERRAEIVRDQLYQLYLGRPHGGKLNLTLTSELPGNVLSLSLDPLNVTLEAEHFADVDRERYAQRKPLLWFWQMFDRSPIGLNHWLGLRFRCMLGRHIFEHVGSGVKIHHGVDLTYGYKLSIGDGVVIRQRALLNDRGGIRIGNNAVIGSYARIYSHVHDPQNYEIVRLQPTEIGAGARIGSHMIVLAGRNLADGEVAGTFPTDTI
jgi:acetyltransferase-like isoleucine patch superfamily enzyme